jgi:hypothetical protein
METYMCCGVASLGRGSSHRDGCLSVRGWEFKCSCSGQYHDDSCDGRWVSPDGQSSGNILKVSGFYGDINRPDIWDGKKLIPWHAVFSEPEESNGWIKGWRGWPDEREQTTP